MSEAGTGFEVNGPVAAFARTFHLPLIGRHQAINALLAIALAAELGLDPEEVRRGLLACIPPKMRLQLWTGERCRVLDDSYNANADSMRAALETLRDLPCRGRRIAVLGDMAELGAHTEPAHVEIGQYVVSAGIDHLITTGRMAEVTAQAARDHGLQSVEVYPDVDAAAAALERTVGSEDIVLLKGSRVSELERISDRLRGKAKPEGKADLSQGLKSLGNQ
jgi:UDP-N-acetylmuramoyl-tripeptide--D-alanyl-D-alanine ligase